MHDTADLVDGREESDHHAAHALAVDILHDVVAGGADLGPHHSDSAEVVDNYDAAAEPGEGGQLAAEEVLGHILCWEEEVDGPGRNMTWAQALAHLETWGLGWGFAELHTLAPVNLSST